MVICKHNFPNHKKSGLVEENTVKREIMLYIHIINLILNWLLHIALQGLIFMDN